MAPRILRTLLAFAFTWALCCFPAKSQPGSRTLVVAVGVNAYARQQYHALPYAADAARKVAEALQRARPAAARAWVLTCGAPDAASQPTRSNVLEALANAEAQASTDSQVVFFFCGHGIEVPSAGSGMPKQHLLLQDVASLENAEALEAGSLELGWLRRRLEAIPCQTRLLWIDACRATPETLAIRAGASPTEPRLTDAFRAAGSEWQAEGSATLYSCSVGESAFCSKAGQSYFAEAVVEGLDGKATDPEGSVTMASLYRYVRTSVADRIKRDGRKLKQAPVLHPELSGQEIVLRQAPPLLAIARFGGPSGEQVSDALYNELARSRGVRLVERARLKGVLSEVRLQSTGLTDAATAAEIGRLANARYVVLGSITQDDRGRVDAQARLSEVATGAQVMGVAADCQAPRVDCRKIARSLAGTLLARMQEAGVATAAQDTPGGSGPKKRSNMGLVAGGIAAAGGLAVALGGGGGGGGGGAGAVTDRTPPVLQSASAEDSTRVLLVFDEALRAPSVSLASHYAISPAVQVTAAQLLADARSVRLTTAEQRQGQSYRVTVTGVQDAAGNAIAGPGTSATFTGKGIPPKVVSATAVAGGQGVDLLFDESVDEADAVKVANYTINPTLAVTGARMQDTRTIRLTTAEQSAATDYTVTVKAVRDVAGNPLAQVNDWALFRGAGAGPAVASARSLDPVHVEVVFGETVDPVSAGVAANYTLSGSLSVLSAQRQADGRTVWLETAEQRDGAAYAVTVAGVRDLAGNPVGSTNNAGFTGKGILPQVLPTASAQDSTHVLLTFSEAVGMATALVAGNYSLSGGLTVAATPQLVGLVAVRLTTSPQTAGTSYTVTVRNVTDAAGNPVGSSNVAGFVGAGAGGVPLQVVSATVVDATGVEVLFSKAVDATTAGSSTNYRITPDLAVGAVQVLGTRARLTTARQTAGLSYTVTVTGVRDTEGNLVVPPNSTTFVGGQAPLRLLSATSVSSTRVGVTFNRAVSATSAGSPASYSLTPTLVVTGAQVAADGWSVALTTAEQTGSTEYTLSAAGLKDSAGGAIDAGASSTRFTGTGSPPQVSVAVAVDANHLIVGFSEEVDATSAGTASHYAITPALGVTSAVRGSDGKSVELTTADQTGGTRYTVTVTGVLDAAANPVSTSANAASFTGIAPSFRVVSVLARDAQHVDLTFNRALDAASAVVSSNYAISPALAISSASLLSGGKGVRLSTARQSGGITYTLTVTGVKDSANNQIGPPGNVATFDGLAPAVVSARSLSSTQVAVVFSRALDATSANVAANYTFSPSLQITAAALQAGGVTVHLTTSRQANGATYTVTVAGVKDTGGNPIGSANASAMFTSPNRLTLTGATVVQTGGVAGSNLGDYEYRVTYTQTENTAPAYVRITVTAPGGSPVGTWDMAKQDPTDSTYTDDCGFAFRPSILTGGIGSYAYQIDASDGSPTPASLAADGPQVTVLDGGRIAFTSHRNGNWEVYTSRPDGNDVARLTIGDAADQAPAWSPDGTRIAFVSWRDGNAEVYVARTDGSGLTRLTNNPAADSYPCWSPDGTRIAFMSDRAGSWDVWVMKADGSDQASLSPTSGLAVAPPAARRKGRVGVMGAGLPSWCPDGTRVAFGAGGIVTVRADGTSPTRLTQTDDQAAAWSPDGLRIAFQSLRDGNCEIYVMNADGSGQTRLTNNLVYDGYPCWSPDGKRILFCSERDPAYGQLWVMNADGSAPTRITALPDGGAEPDWSWGSALPAPAPLGTPAARKPGARLRAACRGAEAEASLTESGVRPSASAARASGTVRFVPLPDAGLRSPVSRRSWLFAVEARSPDAQVTLSWPDLSGLGSRDRVVLEDLDTDRRRSMRTTASYVFRGQSRRFRVTAEPRTSTGPMLTGLEMVGGRGAGGGAIRFTLSTAATVDVELLSPSGRTVALLARGHSGVQGLNQVSWRGDLAPGVYLLRARTTTDDGASVQATRPVVVAR